MKISLFKTLQRAAMMEYPRAFFLGFASLKAYLNKMEPGQHEVRYCPKPEHLKEPFDFLGISSVTEAWEDTKKIIQDVRYGGYDGPIVVGGPHITALPQTLPKEATCGVVGQGEESFVDLVRLYSQHTEPDLSQVVNLVYWDGDELKRNHRSNGLPLDEIPIDVTEQPTSQMQVSTIRGCPFSCQHCVETPMQGKTVRYLSAERLVDTLEARVRSGGVNNFFFQDDTFLAAPGRLQDIYEVMSKRGVLGRYYIDIVSLNAGLVRDEDTVPLLKAIGVRRLGVGCESFNPRVFKDMKGFESFEDLDRVIRYATENNIVIGGSQVYGFPSETEEELLDSIKKVKEYEKTTTYQHWSSYVCQPLPGGKLWYWGLKKGFTSDDMDFSTLRIDGMGHPFTTPWLFCNTDQMSKERFVDILTTTGARTPGYMV